MAAVLFGYLTFDSNLCSLAYPLHDGWTSTIKETALPQKIPVQPRRDEQQLQNPNLPTVGGDHLVATLFTFFFPPLTGRGVPIVN